MDRGGMMPTQAPLQPAPQVHAQVSDRWIILRCSGRATLRLMQSLAEDGYEAWAPSAKRVIRVPSKNARRDVTLPIMPGFVFARDVHLIDLLELAAMPIKPRRGHGCSQPAHADFSVFHYLDRIPLIAERDLEPLRMAEAISVPRRKRSPYASGSEVSVTRGSFSGMTGVVEKSDGHYAQVWLSLFGRHMRVKISTFILKPIGCMSADQAALKAA